MTSKKVLIIIPTYNEKENIREIIETIFQVNNQYHILVVDDNSPDKTWEIVQRLQKKNLHLHLIKREFKQGLGSAYLLGFYYAIQNKFDYIFQMDGDFSHDPKVIPQFLEEIQTCDWVVGSRYIKGGQIQGWDNKRRLISWLGNFYTKLFLGWQIKDWTAGFNCWQRKVLKKIILNNEEYPNGYAFQIALKYKGLLAGFPHREIPITFQDRRRGKTKLGGGIVNEAALTVIKLRIRKK